MKLGQLEVDLDELRYFLVHAKIHGYAGSGVKQREKDGSKTFEFVEGNFHYTDNYAGSHQAPGQEIVRWQRQDGQRIWYMAYSGGMLPKFWDDKQLEERTYAFLKEALMRVSPDFPFRGPEKYEETGETAGFSYRMIVEGDIERFSGREWIKEKGLDRVVFSQDFIGGLVVPK